MTLRYHAGNEHNPSNPFGRHELTVDPDGTARLDHYRVGWHKAWGGMIDGAVLKRVSDALVRAGFPTVPEHPLPASSTRRTLIVGDTAVDIEWHAGARLPGYDEAFAILDSLVC